MFSIYFPYLSICFPYFFRSSLTDPYNTIHPQSSKPDHRTVNPTVKAPHLGPFGFCWSFLEFPSRCWPDTSCDANMYMYIYIIKNTYLWTLLLLLLLLMLGQKSKWLKWMESTRESSIYIPFANDVLCI